MIEGLLDAMVHIDNQHEMRVISQEYNEVRSSSSSEGYRQFNNVGVSIDSTDDDDINYTPQQLELFSNIARETVDEIKNAQSFVTFADVDSDLVKKLTDIMRYYNIVGIPETTEERATRVYYRVVEIYPSLDLLINFKRYVMLCLLDNETRLPSPETRIQISWNSFWKAYSNTCYMTNRFWESSL